ncbi:MAG: hypothetical protein AMJ90_05785 [candidate division Zixibacteria bacterium SM23_73_2]|nr:MAG: hypothetical protein AMJ90_05785 [candidate division Zixibacteria bacterium SM23_73_2]
MKNKKEILRKAKLYVIVDKDICPHKNIEKVVSDIIKGGAQMIQYRDKSSSDKDFLKNTLRIKKITSSRKIPLIINDRVDIAKLIDAEGVHLGEDDLPPDFARRILGKNKMIGVTIRNLKQAKAEEKKGADYLGLGPVFHTTSKKTEKIIGVSLVKEVQNKIKIPVFPIGGINVENIEKLTQIGCTRVCVLSAVLCSKNPLKAAENLLHKLTQV